MQLRIILPLILFLSINLISQNTQMTFTGAGGDDRWNNANNWEPRGIPSSDRVNVLIPEGKTVDLGGDIGLAANITNNGTILGALGLISKGDITNEGVIVGVTDWNLHLICEYLTNHGSIGAPGEYGKLKIEARTAIINDGILEARRKVDIKGEQIENNAEIYAKYDIKVYAGQRFFNKGKVYTIGNADQPAGNSIDITCVNTEGTSEFYNTGTIEGGDGEDGMNGDQIRFWADFWRNRGNIESGEPGAGEQTRGGDITVSANLIDNAGVISALEAFISFLAKIFKHNPNYNDSPLKSFSQKDNIESMKSEYFRLEADYIWIEGKELLFGNLGNYGSGTTIIGTEAIYISNTNEDDSFMDFSENNFPGTIVSNNLILFTSDNIIEPAGGLASLCSITPQITQGGVDVFNGVILAEDINDSSGATNQGTALFKNQCSFQSSFPYSITSQLGWVTNVSAETGNLNPWEVFPIEFDYEIPAGLTEETIDTIIVSVEMSQFWTLEKKFALICNPVFITSVETQEPLISLFELKQNYPNPFNPTTTINYSIPNVVDANYAPTTNVTLVVYNSLGQLVATLVNEKQPAGNYEVKFDAGRFVSGMYFYQIITDSFADTKKMVLIK